MEKLLFTTSEECTIGIELELQLIDPTNFDLATKSKELINALQNDKISKLIKPEITQSMIEVNSSIHATLESLHKELINVCQQLNKKAQEVNTYISGGGAHPFQFWASRKIFPSFRFMKKSREHGFLSKHFTVFGMHIHIGCTNAENALYLTHIFSRYVPHLIALSASSPFYQGAQTGFQSTRAMMILGHPFGGVIPYFESWQEFSDYFNKMRDLNIIETMKDIYWDVRPKPEFGTIEIRICDMPLTLRRAIVIGAYAQTLAHYILLEKSFKIQKELYVIYSYNRLQSAHFGFKGNFIDPYTMNMISLKDDILKTLKILESHAREINTTTYLEEIHEYLTQDDNDALKLIQWYDQVKSLDEVVKLQCQMWLKNITN